MHRGYQQGPVLEVPAAFFRVIAARLRVTILKTSGIRNSSETSPQAVTPDLKSCNTFLGGNGSGYRKYQEVLTAGGGVPATRNSF